MKSASVPREYRDSRMKYVTATSSRPAIKVALKTPNTSSSGVLCRCGRYRPIARSESGQMTRASDATMNVSSGSGSSGYGQVRGEPKRRA